MSSAAVVIGALRVKNAILYTVEAMFLRKTCYETGMSLNEVAKLEDYCALSMLTSSLTFHRYSQAAKRNR